MATCRCLKLVLKKTAIIIIIIIISVIIIITIIITVILQPEIVDHLLGYPHRAGMDGSRPWIAILRYNYAPATMSSM